MTDLPPVRLASGIELYPSRAVVPDGLPIDDYIQAIDMLEFLGRGHQWYLGDILLSAEAVHGDEVYNRVHERTGLRDKTLQNYRTVSHRMPESRRRDSVDWTFHEAVCHLDEPAQQDALLDRAEAEGWSLEQLRREVRHATSGYTADSNGFTDDEPTPEEQRTLAAGDRVDCASLEDSPWPDGGLDLIVCSPPYGLGKEYRDGGDIDGWDAYLDAMVAWSTALARLLNPRHGRLALNVPLDRSDRSRRGPYTGRPIYALWIAALLDAGLDYRSSIIWWDGQAGEGTQRGSVDSPGAPHIVAPAELIALMYRGSWSRTSERAHDLSHADWLELGPRGVWQINGESDHSEHPAPWPEEVPNRLVKLLSFRGDTVGDPMCGRGTLGRVAGRLGRKVWLADRSEEYVAIARRALVEARGLVAEEVAA